MRFCLHPYNKFLIYYKDALSEGGRINPEQARTWYGLACKNGHKEGCQRYKHSLGQ